LVDAIYGYRITSPLRAMDTPQMMWRILRGNPEMLLEIREKTDFDGFILYEDNPDIREIQRVGKLPTTLDYAVYEDYQVKAADGRNTTFLTESKDIRFEQGGVIKH